MECVLPERFVVSLQDGSLEPTLPRGTDLVFERDVRPSKGQGVLIRDQAGQTHVRRFVPNAAGGFTAEANDKRFPDLDSEEHGLQVLGVMAFIRTSRA